MGREREGELVRTGTTRRGAEASGRVRGVFEPVANRFPQGFGPYILIQPLGGGGMGHVALAVFGTRGAEKVCVVKRMHLEAARDPETVARFRHEASIARRLSHGAIVQTLAVGDVDGEPYIAQELVEGRDLGTMVSRFAGAADIFPVPLSAHIIREVARGLAYAHDFEGLGLVHRDISPPNVRIASSGEVKLLDFGIATSAEKDFLTRPGQRIGKLSFMAPEQLAGVSVDRRADLYALGVLLWELLTGRPIGAALPDRRDAMAADAPAPSCLNPNVAPALDAVVARALSPAREARFQTAAEMRSALSDFVPQRFDGDAELARYLAATFDIEQERVYRARLVAEATMLLPESDHAPEVASPTPHAGDDALPEPEPSSLPIRRASRAKVVIAGSAAALGLSFFWMMRTTTPLLPAAGPEPPRLGARPPAQPSSGLAQGPPPTARARAAPAGPSAPGSRHAGAPPGPEASSPRSPAPGSGADEPPIARARRAFNRNAFDDAIRFGEAAVREGAGAEAHLLLGNTYLRTGRPADAERHFEEVLRIEPQHPIARERRETARLMSGGAARPADP